MSAEIVTFPGETTLDFDPQRVLDAAKEAGLSEVVICGFDANGNEFFASSVADGASACWHLDRAKWRLMQMVDSKLIGDE